MMKVTNNIQHQRALIEVFSNANIKRVAQKSDFSKIRYRLKKYVSGVEDYTYNEVLSYVYATLFKNYRTELFYKNELFRQKLIADYGLDDTVGFTEFSIGKSIADFVLINGEIQVFEIKTEWDDLSKLEKQLQDYKLFADKIYVVAHRKHLSQLKKEYKNTYIGIIELTEDNALTTVKEAKKYKKHSREEQFKTLRKAEYSKLIEHHYGAIPQVPNMDFYRKCLSKAKKIPNENFRTTYLNLLKQRIPKKQLPKNIPFELFETASYFLNFSERNNARVEKFLNKTIN